MNNPNTQPTNESTTTTVITHSISLDKFLASMLKTKKSLSKTQFMHHTALQSLSAGLSDFYILYESAPPDFKQFLTSRSNFVCYKKSLLEQSEFTQKDSDFLKNEFKIETAELLKIQAKAKYTRGSELLDDLIQSSMSKNERVQALYDLMKDYMRHFDHQTPMSPDLLKKYQEKIDFKKIEKIEKTLPVAAKKIAAKKVSFSLYLTKIKSAPPRKTSKVKSEEQKEFDKISLIFYSFMVSHIQKDFMEVLGVLDVDFLKVFEKMASIKTKNPIELLQKMNEKLDLKTYYESLGEAKREKFVCAFSQICDKGGEPKSASIPTYYSKRSRSEAKDLNVANTSIESTKQWLGAILKLKSSGLKVAEIRDLINIFTSDLQTHWGVSHKEGFDIALGEMGTRVKSWNKEKTQKWEKFKIEAEQSKLDDAIAVSEPSKRSQKYKI